MPYPAARRLRHLRDLSDGNDGVASIEVFNLLAQRRAPHVQCRMHRMLGGFQNVSPNGAKNSTKSPCDLLLGVSSVLLSDCHESDRKVTRFTGALRLPSCPLLFDQVKEVLQCRLTNRHPKRVWDNFCRPGIIGICEKIQHRVASCKPCKLPLVRKPPFFFYADHFPSFSQGFSTSFWRSLKQLTRPLLVPQGDIQLDLVGMSHSNGCEDGRRAWEINMCCLLWPSNGKSWGMLPWVPLGF